MSFDDELLSLSSNTPRRERESEMKEFNVADEKNVSLALLKMEIIYTHLASSLRCRCLPNGFVWKS